MRAHVLLIALPGGFLMLAVLLLLRWVRRRQLARETASLNALIVEKGLRVRFVGHDDSLRVKTQLRRDAADRLKRRAAHVASGATTSDVLRMVK